MNFYQFYEIFQSLVIPITVGVMLSTFVSLIARQKLPIAYSVAIIGFPRSGKTTLITSLFAEVFARRIPSISITPRGEATIKKVNEDIYRLENGETLSPTTDQDLFAYRAELSNSNGFFPKKYKLEVGDFPGEDSEEFVNKDIEWLHELPYFKWAMEADAFVFVIDIQKVLNDQNFQYRSLVSKAFRASWQRLKDHHYNGESEVRRKPTVLVFSKADLLLSNQKINNFDDISTINKMASIEKTYIDLIAYLNSESSNFKVVFTSAYNVRFGIKELLKGIMPEQQTLRSLLLIPNKMRFKEKY